MVTWSGATTIRLDKIRLDNSTQLYTTLIGSKCNDIIVVVVVWCGVVLSDYNTTLVNTRLY